MTIEVKVLPKSGRDEIGRFVNGTLKVRVSAPPIEGKANERLIELISRAIGMPRSDITIIKGRTSRIKTISIQGVSKSKFNWFKKTYSDEK
ncbi:MAG: DUF167 domain-containing protein [Thermodesulfobacteriota bacterium]